MNVVNGRINDKIFVGANVADEHVNHGCVVFISYVTFTTFEKVGVRDPLKLKRGVIFFVPSIFVSQVWQIETDEVKVQTIILKMNHRVMNNINLW